MNTHQQSKKYSNKRSKESSPPTEMKFGQKGLSKKDGHQDTSNIICYNCGEKGHYASTCPKKKNENKEVHTNIEEGWEFDGNDDVEYMYHQTDKNQEWDDRILIDSQNTINVFKNKKFLTNIHMTGKPCRIHAMQAQFK